MAMKPASAKMMEMLNMAIARELQVSVQYMWQHVMWVGVKGYAVQDGLKDTAVEEMKHAEQIAERLFYLGGTPTTKPDPIVVGKTLKEMIAKDKQDEETAIVLYKKIIDLAGKEGDEVTKQLFRNILSDEEDHHDFFESLLEEI